MNCRACITSGGCVNTSIPSVSGVAQDSIKPPRLPKISTVQIRHDPQARSSGWKQRLGISIPAMRAASRMTVPEGTVTSWPLMVPVTIFCSVRVAVTIVAAFALQLADSLRARRDESRGSVLHQAQFYHDGLVKLGHSGPFGSGEEW